MNDIQNIEIQNGMDNLYANALVLQVLPKL